MTIPEYEGITPTPEQLEELRRSGKDGETVSDAEVQETWQRIIAAEKAGEF